MKCITCEHRPTLGWYFGKGYEVRLSSSRFSERYPNYIILTPASGLYYKHMTIVNDDSSIVIKWSFKLIDVTRGIIYDRHMFIVKATEVVFAQLRRVQVCRKSFLKAFVKFFGSFWVRLHVRQKQLWARMVNTS